MAFSFLLGAIYTIFIVPQVFDEHPEQWGLIQLLLYYTQIISIFVLFSQPSVIIKFYPEYSGKDSAKELLGFSFLLVMIIFCMFGVFWYYFGKSFYFESDRQLYEKYFLILIPILLGSVLFEKLGAYSRILQRSVLPFFLGTSLQKVIFFFTLVVMLFTGLSFNILILLLIVIFLLKPLLLVIDLAGSGLFPKLILSSFKRINIKRILDYSVYGLFGGIAYLLIMRVDSLMIGNMLGLDQLAYYSIPVFLVTAMSIPEKSVAQISLPVISSLHASSDYKGIEVIYKKVSISQFFLGGIFFLLIWINIDVIMEVLGEKFGNTTWAFFFLGIGKMIDLLTSANGQILNISEIYRYNLVLQVFLMILAVGLNYFLIPKYGINGAAIATASAIILYNLIKTYLIYRWFSIHPFSETLILVVSFLVVTGLLLSVFTIDNLYLSLLIKSLVFASACVIFVLKGGASDDIRNEFLRIIRKYFFNAKS